jgi:hypothetical protein
VLQAAQEVAGDGAQRLRHRHAGQLAGRRRLAGRRPRLFCEWAAFPLLLLLLLLLAVLILMAVCQCWRGCCGCCGDGVSLLLLLVLLLLLLLLLHSAAA